MITYISDTAHYKEVLTRIPQVKHSLWIGTADIKDLYMDLPAGRLGVRGDKKVPLLGVLAKLIQRGVEVRLIHAKEPGPNFREDFDKYPVLFSGLERVLCPRVHFKMIIMDGEQDLPSQGFLWRSCKIIRQDIKSAMYLFLSLTTSTIPCTTLMPN